MKEYIEREAVFQELDSLKADIKLAMLGVYKAVDAIPAADVAPVIHGEWIRKNGEMYCSVCGGEALMDEVYYKSPYCPDCGAKMDGGNLNA